MKYLYTIVLVGLIGALAFWAWSNNGDKQKIEEEITLPYQNTLEVVRGSTDIPRSLKEDGSLKTVNVYNWTSGFFAGSLWYLYELTNNEQWKNDAIYWTEVLDTIQYWTGNHDVGFMMNCSYGNALRLCGNEKYRQVIINTAESLCTRFNPKTGSIKSWNYRKAWDGKTEWYYPVIIDNMMNLELLFLATELSGNNKYKELAITHALTTMKNHYRDDYSCCHVVDYDAETGAVLDKATCQGFTDESSWARGQAWGLYGFVMCYRETGDQRFLDFAKNIAGYIMNSPLIPADKIPYWDYHVNQPSHTPEWNYQAEKYDEIPRDVSAATITASALFNLSTMLEDGQKYYAYADAILKSVLSPSYCTRGDDTAYFYLKQSVGSVPHGGEISQPVNYADYYYFEALLRKQNIDNSHD